MTRFERSILKDLYESANGLFAFSFYSRYKIEPEDMFFFINTYSKKGIIKYESDRLILTKEGKDIILKQLFNAKKKGDKYSNIPFEFKANSIGINLPYLPDVKSVSSEILNLKEGGIETSIEEV